MSLLDKILKPLRKIFRKTSRGKKFEKQSRRPARKPVSLSSRKKAGSPPIETGKTPTAKKIPARKKSAKAVKKTIPKKAVKKSVTKKESRPKPKPAQKKVVAPGAVSGKSTDRVKEALIGEITHYFPRIQVAVVKVTSGALKLKDHIHITGRQTELRQVALSLQIESSEVKIVRKGQLAGLKMEGEAQAGDKVYKVG